MNFRLACLTTCVFAFTCPPWGHVPCQAADDELDVTETYSQIVADYQQIAANGNDAALAAASRLIGHAYRRLIDQAKGLKLEADDLYALAGCHEGLGELDKAKQFYARSLAAKADPRTHLALVRLNLGDLQAAEKHFAAAIKLDPQYPGLIQFHLGLANAHQRKRNWQDAARHLQRYVHYAKSLSDVRPGDRAAQAAFSAT